MYCLHLLILSHTDSCSLSFSASIAQTLVFNTLQIYIVLNIILFIIIISIFFNRIIIYPSPFSINNFWSFLLQLKSCPSFDVELLKLTQILFPFLVRRRSSFEFKIQRQLITYSNQIIAKKNISFIVSSMGKWHSKITIEIFMYSTY